MAILHPFRAVRPLPEKAKEIACVPYDVINSSEAFDLAKGKPLSFLHIIRPEISLPAGMDEHDDEVYAKGAENLQKFIDGPYTVTESEPSLYVYRLIMDGRSQTGVFGCVSVKDYDDDVILKHELTRPSKEDDRTRHITQQRAHAEPIMLTFKDDPRVAGIIKDTITQAALYDLVSEDGVQHTIWKVSEPSELVRAFNNVSNYYVADGHHRCKAASRAALASGKPVSSSDEVNFFPAVLFPMGDMKILSYNRVIKVLPKGADTFLTDLKARFDMRPTSNPVPSKKGDICLFLKGAWYTLTLPAPATQSAVDSLDVGRLTDYVLKPMLDITDPRTDLNIDFVGGIRGTSELERLVNSGLCQLAISMYPTSIEELVQVSDAGLLMPPKSTWFEPKLRSGFLVHTF
ncbi:MAG: DUF1015 family protein [Bacteroidetes bacterium]|nr:DUF1015 family protein [Bacteroidota bacterium]